jgi:hypothetical protein
MLTVEPWPLARLIPYARNPRKNDEAVDRMCAAIREFGFVSLIASGVLLIALVWGARRLIHRLGQSA